MSIPSPLPAITGTVNDIVSIEIAALLFVVALFAGVGISAIGPGGIFVTIMLFLVAPIASATAAGTASLTFIFTGALATLLFRRSGDFAVGYAREIAIILSGLSIVGAYDGSQANLVIPDRIFGYLLAVFVAIVGGLLGGGPVIAVPILVLVGVPQLIGVVVGWRIAHLVEEGWLRIVLGVFSW